MSHKPLRHLLIVRLSALGDVAILAAILPGWATANPDVHFTVAGPPLLEPLFSRMGLKNVDYVGVKKRQPTRAIWRQLSAVGADAVADLHVVNRVLPSIWVFRLRGLRVRSLRKGRTSRWLWLHGLSRTPRRPQWERYADVLRRLGLTEPSEWSEKSEKSEKSDKSDKSGNNITIGVAPFAQHQGKMWPLASVEALVERLCRHGWRVLLFGSKDEAALLEPLAARHSGATSVAGRHTFADELDLIASLDAMVSMDSANMHFASALGVPVVSVWGATHPQFGFYGYGQPASNAVCLGLGCQPCSAFGQKRCRRGDYPCLQGISPQMVAEKVENLIAAQ